MRLRTVAFLFTLALGILVAPLAADAQQAGKVYRIGVLGLLTPSEYSSRIEAFRRGLLDLGYVEGKNIVIEYRWAQGKYDRLPDLAAELVRLKVDLIVTHGTPGPLAAKRATTTIPIVMGVSGDAVGTGLVASIARPGGNITGSTFFFPELMAKRLELLKEAVPSVRRMAVLVNPDNPGMGPVLKAMEATGRALKAELQQFAVRKPDEFESAFSKMAKRRADALVVIDEPILLAQPRRIADLAATQRLPTIGSREYVEAGGLMAYAVNFPEIWRRAAVFVDKILKGAKPADLPVEQASKYELVINLKTAKALGLTIPPSVLIRADEVIK